MGAFSNVSDYDVSVSQGDSAPLRAYIYSESEIPLPPEDLVSVQFTVQDPKGVKTTVPGVIEDDGAGFKLYNSTEQIGKYIWVARFTLADSSIRSKRGHFVVVDPFRELAPSNYDEIAAAVWTRLEDCFDSQEGGPWLKDMTLGFFDQSKIPQFVNEGLLLVNYTSPITELSADFFIPPDVPADTEFRIDWKADPNSFIIVQATLLATIKHLMRSYVEQPDLVGANVVRETRRDYLQRWGVIYQIENDAFKTLLPMWKRQFLNFGHTKMLVHNKAGRAGGPGQGYIRTRNVGRGGWGY